MQTVWQSQAYAPHLLVISMAMAMHRNGTELIDQCVLLRASIEATEHRNRSSIHSVLSRQLLGSHTNKQNNKTNTSIAVHFWWPWQWASVIPSTSTIAAHPGLQLKPLDAAIRWVYVMMKCCGHRNAAIWLDFWGAKCWGWRNFVGRWQLLHKGVTYQSDGKDLADGVKYLYWGAKLVS